MRVAIAGLSLLLALGEASAAELRYDALMLFDLHAPPEGRYAELEKSTPVSRFECLLGPYKTKCILPRYTPEQMLGMLEVDGSVLQGLLAERFPEMYDKAGEDGPDYLGLLRQIGQDDILTYVDSSPRGQQLSGIFEFGPIPVFPSTSFVAAHVSEDFDGQLTGLRDFDQNRFAQQIGRLTLDDFGEEADIHPLWSSVPMSYEPVDSPMLESAWDTWVRLASESDAACPYNAESCGTPYVVHTFVEGPADRHSGIAVCIPVDDPVHLARECTVMAYANEAGDRYVKALMGPNIAVEAGGPINSAGMIDLTCNKEDAPDRAMMVQQVSTVLTTPRYNTEVPLNAEFVHPDKILVAINDGRRLRDFSDKFVFLHVTGYESGFGFWLNIAARAWIRAEADPTRYPVFSETEAIQLTNFLTEDFEKYGYLCRPEM